MGFLFLILAARSQPNHTIGFGLGLYASDLSAIEAPNLELQYAFVNKALYSKFNTMLIPTRTTYYKFLSQSCLFIGLRPNTEKRVIPHFAIGIRGMYTEANADSKKKEEYQLKNQINGLSNIGVVFKILKRHSIFLDSYVGLFRIYKSVGKYSTYAIDPDISLQIGYSYLLK
jgi:hypothetical protein